MRGRRKHVRTGLGGVRISGHQRATHRLSLTLAVWVLVVLLNPGVAAAQEPVSRITSPQPGATLREVAIITGTATHPGFSFYKLEYALEPGSNWVIIGETHGNQVQDGELARWDTRTVPDGSYSIRLLVVDTTGNYKESIVRQVVVANAGPAGTETATTTATPDGTGTATPTVTVTPTLLPATPTVLIEMPVLETPSPPATRPTLEVGSTTEVVVPDADSGTGDALMGMVGGVISEVLDATGISGAFSGLSSSVVNGAMVAVGAFAVVGVLALVRQIVLLLYHAIRR